MKSSELAALLNEPACTHNLKSKSGCARPTPGATAGGCTFDGAQIALLPIADVAQALSKSEDAIKGLQRRGLIALRQLLVEWEISYA